MAGPDGILEWCEIVFAMLMTVQPCQGVQFYGRGYIQLSWSYNYKAASKALLGNEIVLYNDPDLVGSLASTPAALQGEGV